MLLVVVVVVVVVVGGGGALLPFSGLVCGFVLEWNPFQRGGASWRCLLTNWSKQAALR